MGSKTQNYYEILEVATDAPDHEIRAAYLRAKDTYSPDSPALYSMFTKEEAEQLQDLIEEAFLVLGDQSKRQKYDMKLMGKEFQEYIAFSDVIVAIVYGIIFISISWILLKFRDI